MKIKITCAFEFLNSHFIENIGFRGENKIELEIPFIRKDFLVPGTSLEICKDESNYIFVVISDSLQSTADQIAYLDKAVEFISFVANRNEPNPHYGNNYARIIFGSFSAVQIDDFGKSLNGNYHISASCELTSNRIVRLNDEPSLNGCYHEIIRLYFNGLTEGNKKSKYFHWFLVLEVLEGSTKYKKMFGADKLFNEQEEYKIKNLANALDLNVKKNAILGLLSRTKYSRVEKLLQLLEELGITSTFSCGQTTSITSNTIKIIVHGRNALFHTGSDFPEEVLWWNLFPLVTQVVECVSRDPACLAS